MLPFQATQVTVRYGSSRGIADVSLDARPGEVLGLLGPNGAGKTTLLRAALDLVLVTSGRITLLGRAATDPKAREAVTYLPGDLSLPKRLTGRQALARFTASRAPVSDGGVARLAAAFGVDLDRRIGALSKGNRQKVGLVIALAPRTPLLLLDEPTSGLDPLVQQVFADELAARREAGATVILSSHVLSELEHLADRVAVLRDGRLAAVESISTLQERNRQTMQVQVVNSSDAASLAGALASLPDVVAEWSDATTVQIDYGTSIDPVLKALAKVTVRRLTTAQGHVEDRLMDYYGDRE